MAKIKNFINLINNKMDKPKNKLMSQKIRQRIVAEGIKRGLKKQKRENIKIKRYKEVRNNRIHIIKFSERKKLEKTKYLKKINNFSELMKRRKTSD